MEDELWMRKIKERLDDYSEPLPVSGWERLEKDLSVSKPPVAGKRRIIPFRRWAVAAAAALLVAVSSVSVWLLQSPVGEEMRNIVRRQARYCGFPVWQWRIAAVLDWRSAAL